MWKGFTVGDRGLTSIGDTHPMWSMAYARDGVYRVVGASAVGRSHLKEGSPRDDAFIVRSLGPWLVVAVSDGLGSRPLSRYGSSSAVEALSTYILEPLVPDFRQMGDRTAGLPPLRYSTPPPAVDEAGPSFIAKGVAKLLKRLKRRQEDSRSSPAKMMPDLFKIDSPFSLDNVYSGLQQVGSIAWWPILRSDAVGENGDEGVTSVGTRAIPILEDEARLKAIIRDAFEKTHEWLQKQASTLELDVRELGCTAVGLLLNVTTGQLAAGQVGDGSSIGLTADGEVLELVNVPETEDQTTTATITSSRWEEHLVCGVWSPPGSDRFTTYFVMSDGVSSDLLYSPDRSALVRWAQTMQRNLLSSPTLAQAAAGLLHWLATYEVVGSWDDRTLVAVVKEKEADANSERVTQ